MDSNIKNKIIIGVVAVILLIAAVFAIGTYIDIDKNQLPSVPKEETGIASYTNPCLVLLEGYCKSGKLIYSQMIGADAIAFNAPEGMPVFAPYDGEFAVMDTRESETASRYPLYQVYKDGKYDEIFNAVFTPSLKSQTDGIADKINGTNIKKGTLIGYVSGKNITLKDYPKENFNLIVSLTKKGVQRPDEWSLDPEMKKLFNQ